MYSKRLVGAILLVIALSWLLNRCRSGYSETIIVNKEVDVTQPSSADRTMGFHPSWSPDGRRFAFHRRIDGWKHIFTVEANGDSEQQLTSGENANFDPDWSTRDQIAFVCNRNATEQICVVNRDGSDLRQLTTDDSYSQHPSWSPTGDRLVFWHDCSLYFMDADGANILLFLEGSEFRCISFPDWSPDGQQIAFRLSSASGGALYVINVDGANAQQITDGASNDRKPTWSPDGLRIAFERNEQLFVINADGTGLTALTSRSEVSSRYPDWSSQGESILYERLYGSDTKYGDRLFQIHRLEVP